MFEIVTSIIIAVIVISFWLAFRHTSGNPVDNDPNIDQDAINLNEAFAKLKDDKDDQ